MTNSAPELLSLLSKWSSIEPDQEGRLPDEFYTIEKEIRQLCDIAENSLVVKKDNPETDFKPTFIFQLATDETQNPEKQVFNCVYEFCQHFRHYCDQSDRLHIEKDWLKLLLATSSHNYDRFMWIHLTFQGANHLKLSWDQVERRLMSRFDDPNRSVMIRTQLEQFTFTPTIESLTEAYQRFKALAKEAHYDVRHYFVNGLPAQWKETIQSTLQFDDEKNFYYTLDDILQRAVLFSTASDNDYVFYNKVAHVAVKVEHQKVTTTECEFHLMAEHATTVCPDNVVVKYPFMEFTPTKTQTTKLPTKQTPAELAVVNAASIIDKVISQVANGIPQPSQQITPEPVKAVDRMPLVSNHYRNTNQLSPQQVKMESFSLADHTAKQAVSTQALPDLTSFRNQYRPRSRSPQRENGKTNLRTRESGCYYHGIHANHTTNECKQAQMVISPNRSRASLPSPPPPPPPRSRPRLAPGEENICIFCQLPFKPGHLAYCKEVRGPKKPKPNHHH